MACRAPTPGNRRDATAMDPSTPSTLHPSLADAVKVEFAEAWATPAWLCSRPSNQWRTSAASAHHEPFSVARPPAQEAAHLMTSPE